MDKSLDDIIATRPKGMRKSGGRVRSPRAQVLGSAGPSPAARARYSATAPAPNSKAPAARPATTQAADKIIVSNLPYDVNEAQIKELFHSTVGPLREVSLSYDGNGRSKGIASVQFQRKGDGTKAYQQYNSRLIDGKRAMKIEIVVDPITLPTQSLASRVAPAPAAAGAPEGTRRGGAPKRGGGGARGRGGAGAGGRKKAERPAKSVADLDAEMEDYTASTGPAAAPAAPAAV